MGRERERERIKDRLRQKLELLAQLKAFKAERSRLPVAKVTGGAPNKLSEMLKMSKVNSQVPFEGKASQQSLSPTNSPSPLSNQNVIDLEKKSNTYGGPKRKISFVWEHFKKQQVNGACKAICNYCNKYLGGDSKNGTNHLIHHFERSCTGKKVLDMRQKVLTNNFNREREREMEIDLSPKLAKKVYGGDGGAYYAWSPDELPMLRQGNIGAAKLSLDNNGFALPHYSDSAKVAYVLQGKGVVGIVLPEKEEKVITIKKGDAIAVPFGVVTWWYNKEDTKLVVLFLGDTSKAHKSGSFTDFFVTGSNCIFTGFSTDFVSRAWDLKEDDAKTLVAKQTGNGIVKLEAGFKMPEPNNQHRDGMALNCEEAPLDVDIKKGGRVVVLNTKNLPLVGEVGLGADLVRLDGSAMCSPGFSCDSALQVTYIVRGSGRVQIVGIDGKRVLETTLKGGNLFIVPRFFVVSKIADPEGMEWFSIITTPDPIFTHLAGSTAPWKGLSPEVVRASFNVDSDVEQQFRSKRAKEAIFFPPN